MAALLWVGKLARKRLFVGTNAWNPSLLILLFRFATLTYGPGGEVVRERLWRETVAEFKFADLDQALATDATTTSSPA